MIYSDPNSSTASWIWHSHPFELRERYPRFRRRFSLDRKPTVAELRITADARYRVWINGRELGFGPARSWPWHQCVDTYDVAPLMRRGENVLAAQVYQPGYSHFSYVHRAAAGLWAELQIQEEVQLVTDVHWKASPDPAFDPQTLRISIYGGGQERRDMRLAEEWWQPDYDDAAWPEARVMAVPGQPPWLRLEPRSLPLLNETTQKPRLLEALSGPFDPDDDPHQLVRAAYSNGKTISAAFTGPLPAVKPGRVIQLIYGWGFSREAALELQISGARGGEEILVTYFEKGEPGAWIIADPATYCHVRMTDRFILRAGEQTLAPFTPRGGRYAMVSIPGPLRAGLRLSARVRHRSYPLTWSKPLPRNRVLRQVAEMCRRTIEACALDGIVDCAWREQAQWLGDGVITGRIVAECCGDVRPLRRMLQLAAQGAARDGILPGVLPSEAHSYVVLDYNFAWVEGLRHYLDSTPDDTAFVSAVWPVLRVMLARFQRDLNSNGLLLPQPGRRLHLDWAELDRSHPHALYNLRYLYALQLANQLAQRLGEGNDRRRWEAWAHKLVRAIRNAFHRNGRWIDTATSESRSQHTSSFLVLTNLVSAPEAKGLMDEAVATSLDQPIRPLVLASPYGHYYLFEGLHKLGRFDDLHAIVRHRWGHWLARGAVTTWENWDVDFPDGSVCHSWSAHPLLYV